MKVSLSFEKGSSKDLSIVVDALRASTTITVALDKFKEIYPAYTPEQAIEIAKEKNLILAGERKGRKLEGFELGNSPTEIKQYEASKDSLVLTTSNGVRIMENMESEIILIGGFVNAKACAKLALELATEEIELVMGGINKTFAIEDFLAAGEILYWIQEELKNNASEDRLNSNDEDYFKEESGISEYALSAILASRDKELADKICIESKSGRRLTYLGYKDDITLCIKRNISEKVGIYKDGKIRLYKPNK
ncbi:2-phosphosulfolactate phosphatase [Methanobrevibacter olleyae]|uniref:2-phosphosulfolactate phosphatase n=1 Tax=Methanobrevibacter olleyae TaxID=294671 RepID=A0A126R1R9_METOL|nr:2-phosphosulfolactate phosphatase [Methanobrevibacter olleyae]AMK15956.1 2-phosphosulfolactate phosphatase ComB [Methanobrevibacter olleyae]SFL16240.1 2-phosphosulfolactate phosphatase [Methanobrevibacter olleyae]